MLRAIFAIVAAWGLSASAMAQPKRDAANCNDHPLFGRLPSYWIESCIQKASNSYKFSVGGGYNEVEGKYWYIRYQPPAGQAGKSNSSEVLRHFETTIKNDGGVQLYSDSSKETFRLTKNGKDNWVEAFADHTGRYILTIVEKPASATRESAPVALNTDRPKPAPPPSPPKRVTAKCHPTYHSTEFGDVDPEVRASLPPNTAVSSVGLLHKYWQFYISDKENGSTDQVLCQYKGTSESRYEWLYRFQCRNPLKKAADTWECDG
jgi:hypothetical protein